MYVNGEEVFLPRIRTRHVRQSTRTFDQTEAGFTRFQQALAASSVPPSATLVVLEATGSSWIGLAVALHQAALIARATPPA